MVSDRPRVACFTPLSPVASGISYYSEDLLPVLARALALDLYVDGYEPTERAMLEQSGLHLRDARLFERTAARDPYTATIYQFGNSPAHAYMYKYALRRPGIVVLHDVVLHHLRLWMAVNGGRAQRRDYVDDLARYYGPAGAALAKSVLQGRTPPTLFDHPLVEPLLATARAVIVHNQASAERVRALRPGTEVRVVPMGVPLPLLPPRDAARERLGVDLAAFVVLSHGHVNPYKRLDVVLRAFRRLVDERPDARLLIAGSVAPGLDTTLDRQVGYLGLTGRVRRLGFVAPSTVADLFAAADCCVNLRYPSAGETSASLLRIMGAGLPVLVSDTASFIEVPAGCAIKVPVGRIEEPLIAEYLIALARDDSLRSGLGAAARAFVAAEHSLERAALGYLDLLAALSGRDLPLPAALDGDTPAAPQPATISIKPAPGAASPAIASAAVADAPRDDPLVAAVADSMAELRLSGYPPLERLVARDLVELTDGQTSRQWLDHVRLALRRWRRRMVRR